MNDYLATTPFDLYELNLFHLVVKHRSFTKAAAMAGLTQSAITRQIKGMEDSLGLELLERTTRSVHATAAGEFLYQESARLLGDVGYTLQRLREDYAGARKEISVGVSRTIALSYLPGFFSRQSAPNAGNILPPDSSAQRGNLECLGNQCSRSGGALPAPATAAHLADDASI